MRSQSLAMLAFLGASSPPQVLLLVGFAYAIVQTITLRSISTRLSSIPLCAGGSDLPSLSLNHDVPRHAVPESFDIIDELIRERLNSLTAGPGNVRCKNEIR
jgi:hypothetical protein